MVPCNFQFSEVSLSSSMQKVWIFELGREAVALNYPPMKCRLVEPSLRSCAYFSNSYTSVSGMMLSFYAVLPM